MKKRFWDFKKWVKSMQTLGYNGARTVIVRISALLYNRAEILTIIALLLGSNGVYIKSFQFLLTFIIPLNLSILGCSISFEMYNVIYF